MADNPALTYREFIHNDKTRERLIAVCVVGLVTVTDPSWLEEYGPAVNAIVEANGEKYIVRDLAPNHLEGPGAVPTVIVLLEFPSEEQARGFYDGPEYQRFKEARQAGSTGDLFMMAGL